MRNWSEVDLSQVNLAALGKSFVLPLLLSPVLAVVVGATIYLIFRFARLRLQDQG